MKPEPYDDHLISIEEAQTDLFFHFAVGPTRGFRFLGVQTIPPQPTLPVVEDYRIEAARVSAEAIAKEEGWL